MKSKLAERLFDGYFAKGEIEEILDENLNIPYDHIAWDHYDCSLEIHGVDPEYRLSDEAQKELFDMGFSTVYVNHTDKWETHYNYGKEFKLSEGWRVSYPFNRDDEEGSILVEEEISSWPKEWFETGYVKIV